MEDYEKLKSVIQTANDEIIELKFGCELLTPSKEVVTLSHTTKHKAGLAVAKEVDGTTFEHTTNDWTDFICIKQDGGIYHYGMFEESKIIGRPIRLADVLVAMNNGDWYVDNLGRFWRDKNGMKIEGNRWNLKDDNLDHQSDPTKQFLINLLVK